MGAGSGTMALAMRRARNVGATEAGAVEAAGGQSSDLEPVVLLELSGPQVTQRIFAIPGKSDQQKRERAALVATLFGCFARR